MIQAHFYNYTTTYCVLYFKGLDFIMYELYFDKITKKIVAQASQV